MQAPRVASVDRAARDLTRLQSDLAREFRRSTTSKQRRVLRRAMARTQARLA